MKGLLTFKKGGIHPHCNKHFSEKETIVSVPIPDMSVVPMGQHIGKPSDCAVNVGDNVTEGMIIGRANGYISANIHSPVTGVVKKIDNIYLPNGMKSQTVFIEKEEGFTISEYRPKREDWASLPEKELREIITDKGIVGLGGATFPAQVKFSIPEGKKVEYFVVNGVECEPYLTADHRLMMEKTDKILEGIKIIAKMIQAPNIIIGIENNKPDAIEAFEKAKEKIGVDLTIAPLKVKYPQGDEKQLIKAVINREVPSGGLPIDIGAVVSSVGTVYAVYEAIVNEKPLIERVVTVSGGAIKNPGNVLARIGTPVKELIAACGGFIEEPAKVIIGGPMMGFSLYDLSTPVIKATSGILALTNSEARKAKRRTSCLSCGRCIAVCPMGLNPTMLFKYIDHNDLSSAKESGLLDCKECGCCAYKCPAAIPLVQGMRLGKRLIMKEKVKV